MARIAWNKRLTDEQEKEIVQRYLAGEGTTTTLAKEYGFKTHNSIRTILIKHGVDSKNEYLKRVEQAKPYSDFSMEKLDTPYKAYFLGLMFTDGWIHSERNMIGLDITDEDAISYLANKINCNYLSFTPKRKKILPHYRLDLRSIYLIEELAQYGVVSNKTKILNPPDLSSEIYLADIIRGIIDGDGWVHKNGKEFFICSASQDFIEWCNNMLQHLGMTKLNVGQKHHGIWILRSGRKANIEILKSVIYKEPYAMARKYNLLHPERRSETIIEAATTGIV